MLYIYLFTFKLMLKSNYTTISSSLLILLSKQCSKSDIISLY